MMKSHLSSYLTSANHKDMSIGPNTDNKKIASGNRRLAATGALPIGKQNSD